MRLSIQQMRCIRDARMKRSEWCGKDFAVFHLALGEVIFGRPKSVTHLMSKRESRAYKKYRAIRGNLLRQT